MQNNQIPTAVGASRVITGRKWVRAAAAVASSALAIQRGRYRWAEFGVRKGKSARGLLKLLPPGRGQLHLFDSWEGLPEQWDRGDSEPVVEEGTFVCDVPEFDDRRVHIHKGWFEDTVIGFKEAHPNFVFDLVHLDCDIYSSTATVLDNLRTMFVHGTVLIFDDLFGYPNWREGQWRAWQEWIGEMPHTWIGHTSKGQAVVRLDGSWG